MKEIQITVKECSIEHCIAEYRNSGRLCRIKGIIQGKPLFPNFLNPQDIIKIAGNEGVNYLTACFELEPISKPVTAEQIRKAYRRSHDSESLIKELGLE